MFVYWTIFVILAAGALLSHEDYGKRSSLLFLALAAVPTALMIGLRWEIGPDWPGYEIIYRYSNLFSLGQSLARPDPGFFLLIWLLHLVSAPFWVLNLVCGIIFVAGLTAFSQRQPNPWLAYLVAFPYLVIVVAMSGDRQSIALGLMFFALNAFERGQLIRFVVLVLAGALFHGSVLLVVPLGLLSYARNSVQRTFLLIVAAALGYYYFRHAFETYALRYSTEKMQSTGVAYRLAMNSMAAALFLIFGRNFALEDHQRGLWRNISLLTLGLVLLLIVVPSSTAVDRFLLYLFPLQFLVLSRIPRALSPEGQTTVPFTLMIVGYAALVQITFLFFGTFSSAYVPYRSIIGM